MTFWESLYLALVIGVFSGFGAMLAYADWKFTKTRGSRPLQFIQDAKDLATTRSVHG